MRRQLQKEEPLLKLSDTGGAVLSGRLFGGSFRSSVNIHLMCAVQPPSDIQSSHPQSSGGEDVHHSLKHPLLFTSLAALFPIMPCQFSVSDIEGKQSVLRFVLQQSGNVHHQQQKHPDSPTTAEKTSILLISGT